MKNLRKVKGILSLHVLFIVLLIFISGCGNSNTAGNAGVIASDNIDGGNQNAEHQSAEGTAMGRYVEEVTDLSDQVRGYGSMRLYQLANGTMIIADAFGQMLVSMDNGVTWTEDTREWYYRMYQNQNYIGDVAIGADNTVAIVYDNSATVEDAGEDDETDEENDVLNQALLVIRPDGTEISVEIPLEKGEEFRGKVGIAEDGRVFVSVIGNSYIYEVKEDGSCEVFLTIPNNSPDLITFQRNLMIMDGFDYKAPLIYDIEKKEYIEDEVLEDFLKENDKASDSYSNAYYERYFFQGEEGVIYLAVKKGLYRHVIGGSAIEQVIDGNLCSFGNPVYGICGMLMLENNEFLTLFSGGRLVRFVYNPDIPAVPSEKLKVYSLEENNTMRQAIALYQTANPETFVEYEVGMEEGSSVTREDALKNLNTRIMAGEGPDVLILDDMPLDSYMEKGLLHDLSPVLDSLNGEEELFSNIVDTMKTGDKVYAMPLEIKIPILMGEEKYISRMEDLESIAETIEAMREDYPEADLLHLSTEKAVIRLFSMTSAPAWITENGEMDKEAITEFLKQTKRIYDAQMDGLPEQKDEDRESFSEPWMAGAFDYVLEKMKLLCETMQNYDSYAYMLSAKKMENFENSDWTLMNGQSSHVFCAETLIGISAASNDIEGAENFVKSCFGKETQLNLFNGFAVNKAAFEEGFIIDEDRIGPDGIYARVATYIDGVYGGWYIYCPDEQQIDELRHCIETADTPYIEDVVLEEAVYGAGTDYIQGSISLDDAVSEIEKKVSIYIAE
ncbi:MAG: hypothetical protein HDR04_06975 [Lachnospiraceae bacterium]|nr:hypothetical protein [Lachnospiraceae bacterium]